MPTGRHSKGRATDDDPGLNRRRFLRAAGVGTAGAMVAAVALGGGPVLVADQLAIDIEDNDRRTVHVGDHVWMQERVVERRREGDGTTPAYKVVFFVSGIGMLIFVGLDSLTGYGTFSLAITGLPEFGQPTGVMFLWALVFGVPSEEVPRLPGLGGGTPPGGGAPKFPGLPGLPGAGKKK